MNYLAHLYLSEDSPGALVGGLMGDFMRGQRLEDYDAAVRRGIVWHRKVDALTDAHPAFLRSRKRLRPAVGHFAGVVADVFYDHFLARSWPRWSSEELPAFARRVYAVLEGTGPRQSPQLRRVAPRMREVDLLGSYRSRGGIAQALERMGRRSRFPVDLAPAMEVLEEGQDGLARDFDELFTTLVAEARSRGWRPPWSRRSGTMPSANRADS